jgi:octopine/nopaline transport system substrate-binding protein|tara:strand:+ start:315 stop:1148 length:834 start_codon:yes stop_codon:yes gene_type:complete
VKKINFLLAILVSLSLSTLAFAGDWSKIRIGTEGAYPPWNNMNAAGELEGAEIDLALDLCERMNAECEFVAQDWDGIIPALQNGKYDAIMAGMSITEERMEKIDFSIGYMTEPASLSALSNSALGTLNAPGKLNLDDMDSEAKGLLATLQSALAGASVGVQTATIHENFLNEYMPDVTIKVYDTQQNMELDLAAGRIDAALCDKAAMETFADTPAGSGVTLIGPDLFGGSFGAGVGAGIRKSDSDLTAMFNKAIADATADGTVSRISMEWFGKDLSM